MEINVNASNIEFRHVVFYFPVDSVAEDTTVQTGQISKTFFVVVVPSVVSVSPCVVQAGFEYCSPAASTPRDTTDVSHYTWPAYQSLKFPF